MKTKSQINKIISDCLTDIDSINNNTTDNIMYRYAGIIEGCLRSVDFLVDDAKIEDMLITDNIKILGFNIKRKETYISAMVRLGKSYLKNSL